MIETYRDLVVYKRQVSLTMDIFYEVKCITQYFRTRKMIGFKKFKLTLKDLKLVIADGFSSIILLSSLFSQSATGIESADLRPKLGFSTRTLLTSGLRLLASRWWLPTTRCFLFISGFRFLTSFAAADEISKILFKIIQNAKS